MRFPLVCLVWSVASMAVGLADGPTDNVAEQVRRIPPPGIAIDDEVRARLRSGADEVRGRIQELQGTLRDRPRLAALLPDVEVFHKAVDWALAYNEFYKTNEPGIAEDLLREASRRVEFLKAGAAPWATATGLVVRAYRSRIDGSVQPYGLVVPATYRAGEGRRHRLDAWFHGRGETLTELDFIQGRMKSVGEFAPPDAFVLHLYGRYCNANKFAGEVDLFEALDDVMRHYPIDADRLVVRGFSMGGAACWQFAVHYSDRWAAAAPGAGFAETPDFLKVFQNESLEPAWYERKLWHWYDCTDYALNLVHCPTVAYSGEKDKQKQAADIMARALAAEGLHLKHVIGRDMGHRYDAASKAEIDRCLDAMVAQGRERTPHRVQFTTWTLRYPGMHWVRLEGLDEHWEQARVEAAVAGASRVTLRTRNVSALTLNFEPGSCPLDPQRRPVVELDGQKLDGPAVLSDRSWSASFHKEGRRWRAGGLPPGEGLRKRPGLQGPVDDAFLDRFLMVRPTGTPLNPTVGGWVEGEMNRAVDHWRRQFRGVAPIEDDTKLTDGEIAACNLVLWGDPGSNRILRRIADRLPITWTEQTLRVGERSFDPGHHAAILVFPNPLNPERYVVLNSGFTFREYDYLNNARQVAKLPDWAVIDLRTPPSSRRPGAVADAGFFNERWELKPPTAERPSKPAGRRR